MQTWKEAVRFSAAAIITLALATFAGRTPVLHATQGILCEAEANHLCVHTDQSGTYEENSYCSAGNCDTCDPISVRCDPFHSGINLDTYWNH